MTTAYLEVTTRCGEIRGDLQTTAIPPWLPARPEVTTAYLEATTCCGEIHGDFQTTANDFQTTAMTPQLLPSPGWEQGP